MEEIIKRINEVNAFLTEENIAKMSTEEQMKYLDLIEQLKARVDVIIENYKGGAE